MLTFNPDVVSFATLIIIKLGNELYYSGTSVINEVSSASAFAIPHGKVHRSLNQPSEYRIMLVTLAESGCRGACIHTNLDPGRIDGQSVLHLMRY